MLQYLSSDVIGMYTYQFYKCYSSWPHHIFLSYLLSRVHCIPSLVPHHTIQSYTHMHNKNHSEPQSNCIPKSCMHTVSTKRKYTLLSSGVLKTDGVHIESIWCATPILELVHTGPSLILNFKEMATYQ